MVLYKPYTISNNPITINNIAITIVANINSKYLTVHIGESNNKNIPNTNIIPPIITFLLLVSMLLYLQLIDKNKFNNIKNTT
jgi:hypothetical protein